MATFDGFTVTSSTLTDAECMALAVNGRLREVFGENDDGTFAPDVEMVRTWAIDTINNLAGIERSKYGTDIPFQGDLYQLKEQEALNYNNDDTPSADKYPILYAESASRNITPSALAQEYLFNAALFPRILAVIEGERMRINPLIKNAATIDDIEAALVSLDYESAVNAILP